MVEKAWYDSEVDILGARFSDGKSWRSVELPNGVVLDISRNGKITGLEIWRASRFFKGNLKDFLSSVEIPAKQ